MADSTYYLIKKSTLDAIADSIRSQKGTEKNYPAKDFSTEILAISGGANPIVVSNEDEMIALMVDGNKGKVVYKDSTSGGTNDHDIGYYRISEMMLFERLYLKDEAPIPEGYVKPSGDFVITENGTFDVTNYASATVNISAVLPQLYAPTISISEAVLTITPTASNGDFATAYYLYIDGVKVASTTAGNYTLSSLNYGEGEYTVKVTAYATNFTESAFSNTVTYVVEVTYTTEENESGTTVTIGSYSTEANDSGETVIFA